jgi:hypothetical protein
LPGIVIILIGGLQARRLHLIRAPEIQGPPHGRNPGKLPTVEAGAKSVDNKRMGRYNEWVADAVDPLAFRSMDCGDAR